MSQRAVVIFTSDLTGKELDSSGETVNFSLDGIAYEIDLSAKEASSLRKALEPYVGAGRRLARNGKPYRRTVLKRAS